MKLRASSVVLFAIASIVLMLHHAAALACTPIDYRGKFPRGGIVEQMVARAATVQVMRATRSAFAWRDPYDAYPPVYSFELEPVDTWKGWNLGVLHIDAFVAGIEDLDWADESKWLLRADGHPWEDPDMIDRFQAWVEPEPESLACRLPYAFQVGETNLVFRDETGGLLEQSFQMTRRSEEDWFRGPVVMPMNDPRNRWARAVRAEISRDWRLQR